MQVRKRVAAGKTKILIQLLCTFVDTSTPGPSTAAAAEACPGLFTAQYFLIMYGEWRDLDNAVLKYGLDGSWQE